MPMEICERIKKKGKGKDYQRHNFKLVHHMKKKIRN